MIKTTKVMNYLEKKKTIFMFKKCNGNNFGGRFSDITVDNIVRCYFLVAPSAYCAHCKCQDGKHAIWLTGNNESGHSGWYCKKCLALYGVPT